MGSTVRIRAYATGRSTGQPMQSYEWPIVIEYDVEEDVFLADCPVLPGCYTDGKTYAEPLENIKDAIRLVIESRQSAGDPIPTPDYVKVLV